jgi:hypothetical protein
MNQEQAINDILEIVSAIKDSMVTRDAFDSRMSDMVTKNDLHESLFDVKSEIMSHVDSFMHLHNKLDTELVALRGKYDRLEGFVKQLAAHANIKLEY